MAEEVKAPELTEQEKAVAAAQAKADKTNTERMIDGKDKEGKDIKVYPKGTLVKVGQTRGRNPQVISYEFWDESKPETLPKTLSEFMEISKISDEPTIVSYLIAGQNDANYTAASDPVAEYVEATWPEEVQKGFRIVVRNYATNAGVSIEDAVALIKPGIVKSQTKA